MITREWLIGYTRTDMDDVLGNSLRGKMCTPITGSAHVIAFHYLEHVQFLLLLSKAVNPMSSPHFCFKEEAVECPDVSMYLYQQSFDFI